MADLVAAVAATADPKAGRRPAMAATLVARRAAMEANRPRRVARRAATAVAPEELEARAEAPVDTEATLVEHLRVDTADR